MHRELVHWNEETKGFKKQLNILKNCKCELRKPQILNIHVIQTNNSSQTEGLITCTPKSGKARNLLKNWRPISLLNTTYKLISLCVTNRVRPILDRIISPEQKGFLSGRSISDCTRMMYDTIFECESKNISGLILLVDFEKAFDSLSWKFIHQALEKFNFGPNFRKWIHMFQKGSKSKVILNGHLSESFELQRGCRQGDPISPYLFILCSEYLTLGLKNERNVEGITINRRERKCSQYADDTSIFLKSTENNLKLCLLGVRVRVRVRVGLGLGLGLGVRVRVRVRLGLGLGVRVRVRVRVRLG